MNNRFKNLHAYALEYVTHLRLSKAELKRGSTLVLEMGPLPELHQVAVFLVEVDGSRNHVCTFTGEPDKA